MRGGTGSPSGLFWATDSLIRVSFTGNPGNYWQYDIVASNISIMSSRSVVEMDGVFYWLGADRFYLYNGVVAVLPNDKNINWLFDNINFDERQKVWATKVPKYNEIWFFYPRGQETECTDAIIYNVKDKIWYDAGQADGARRSAGFTTQIFRSPVWAGWDFNISYSQPFNIISTPSGLTAPTSSQFYLAGNQSGRFAPGSYLKLSKDDAATIYQVSTAPYIYYNTTSYTITSSTTTTITITSSTNYTSVFTAGRAVTFVDSSTATIYKVQSSVFNGTTTVVTFTTTIPSGRTTAYVRAIKDVTLVTTTVAITENKTPATSQTVTISLANPAVITYPSGGLLPNGTQVTFSTTGTLPGNILPGATYYVINGSGTTSNISLSAAGTAISTAGQTQSGTQTVSSTGVAVFGVQGGYSIWQHEYGLNKITVNDEAAIYSSFTTCDLSWVGGTPSEDASPGINRRMHLRRLEPDFVQSGDLYMTILGKKFARSAVESSPIFTITPDTEKVDLRLEYRELRLLFESNEVGGNYELGRMLVTAELGDERP
jgi:hypothetical protein